MKYTEVEAKECINRRLSIVKTAWQDKRDLRNEIYSLYKFWTNVDSDVARGERSNIFVPLAFSIIETKLPRMVQALLSLDPFFKVEGRTQKDHPNAEFMSDLIQFQMTDEINAFYTLVMWFKEAMMYSNAYMYVGWNKETAKIKERIPSFMGNQVIGYDYRMKDDVVYDGLSLNHLDSFDCYPAPYGTRINGRKHERMPYFIVRSEPDAEYLKSLSGKKDHTGQTILDKKAVDDIISRFPQGYGDLDEERRNRMAYNKLVESENRDKYAPKYVMWTMFEHDHWVSIIGNTIVSNKPNPFGDNKIPIVGAIDTPVPHEHVGIGQIEPIIKLNYCANDILNLGLDWLFKSINPGTLISEAEFLDPRKFQNDPDGIHMVKSNVNNAHKTVQMPNLNLGYMTDQQVNIERTIDKTLGQSDVSRGVSRTSKDTATEIVSLIEQANFRFDLSAKLLKHESLVPLLDMMAERNVMFFPYEKEIRKYTENGDPEFMTMNVSQVIGRYRFKMKTNPAQGNKMAYAQTLIRFLDVINASGGQNPGLVMEIAKYLEIDNADEMLDNPAMDAVRMIVQAAQEGLLENGQQAALVLSGVLNQLAPPGSPNAQAVGSQLPAEDSRGVAKQIGASQ